MYEKISLISYFATTLLIRHPVNIRKLVLIVERINHLITNNLLISNAFLLTINNVLITIILMLLHSIIVSIPLINEFIIVSIKLKLLNPLKLINLTNLIAKRD